MYRQGTNTSCPTTQEMAYTVLLADLGLLLQISRANANKEQSFFAPRVSCRARRRSFFLFFPENQLLESRVVCASVYLLCSLGKYLPVVSICPVLRLCVQVLAKASCQRLCLWHCWQRTRLPLQRPRRRICWIQEKGLPSQQRHCCVLLPTGSCGGALYPIVPMVVHPLGTLHFLWLSPVCRWLQLHSNHLQTLIARYIPLRCFSFLLHFHKVFYLPSMAQNMDNCVFK